jgi:hypothetical protein
MPVFGKLMLAFIFLLPVLACGQEKSGRKSDSHLAAEIGRLSGSDTAASAYMARQFRLAGLAPAVAGGYCQDVVYDEGKRYFPGTSLFINGQRLRPDTDFIPLPFGATGTASGEPLIAVQEQKQPWILNVGNFQQDSSAHVLGPSLYEQGQRAVGDKASAVLFYNAGRRDSFSPLGGRQALPIPALYIQPAAAQKYFSDQTASVKVNLTTAAYEKKDTDCNTIGLVNNHAASTIVIGAMTAADKAVLLELARELRSARRYQKQNYLLVAFAPDKGDVSGLRYFSAHLPINVQKVSCVVNLDGTGKANGGMLDIAGTQSSARWTKALNRVRSKKIILQDSLPGSCALFYGQQLPAIAVSYAGEASPAGAASALNFMTSLMRELNGSGKLSFNTAYAGSRTGGQ